MWPVAMLCNATALSINHGLLALPSPYGDSDSERIGCPPNITPSVLLFTDGNAPTVKLQSASAKLSQSLTLNGKLFRCSRKQLAATPGTPPPIHLLSRYTRITVIVLTRNRSTPLTPR